MISPYRLRQITLGIFCAYACLFGTAHALDNTVINASGLPIPRFVSAKSSTINMRVGPGTQYPIKWVYKRQHLPLEIIEEFGHWRKVRDSDGSDGWIHRNLLSSQRFALITADEADLLLKPDPLSPVLVRAGVGNLVHIERCEERWCRVMLQAHSGWVDKQKIWGVYESELIEE